MSGEKRHLVAGSLIKATFLFETRKSLAEYLLFRFDGNAVLGLGTVLKNLVERRMRTHVKVKDRKQQGELSGACGCPAKNCQPIENERGESG